MTHETGTDNQVDFPTRTKITHFADAYTLQRLSELEAKAFERWCKKENKQYRPTDDGESNRRDRLVWQAAQVEMKEDLDAANKWASHYAKRASELEDWKKQAEFGMACMAEAVQQSKRELEYEKLSNAQDSTNKYPVAPTRHREEGAHPCIDAHTGHSAAVFSPHRGLLFR